MIFRTLLALLAIIALGLMAGAGVTALTWFATHTWLAATTACYVSGVLGYLAYCGVVILGVKRAEFL